MIMKLLKELLYMLIFKRKEEGTLNVTESGVITINLEFTPKTIEVYFHDKDPEIACCDRCDKDTVRIPFQKNSRFEIVWHIKSPRKIKWIATA